MRADFPPQPYHVVRDEKLHTLIEKIRATRVCACEGKWGFKGYHNKHNCQPI